MTSPDKRNWGSKFKIWKSKVEVTGNENVKIDFRAHLRRHWIDLRQTKSEMINGPFYIYISAAEMLRFVRFVCLSVCLSVAYLSFTQYWNVVESLCFSGKLPLTLGNGGVFLRWTDGQTDGQTDRQTACGLVIALHFTEFYRIFISPEISVTQCASFPVGLTPMRVSNSRSHRAGKHISTVSVQEIF